MEKLQLWWVLVRVKSSGRFWKHEDVMSCGDPRALEIINGFGNNWWVKGQVGPMLGTDIYIVVALCSFLSASLVFLKWVNAPVKKDLL